jgi:hypothetical protein
MRYLVKHAPDSALEFISGQQMAGIDFADYWPRHEIQLPLYAAAGVQASAGAKDFGPRKIQGRGRSYIIYPSFYAPQEAPLPRLDQILGLTDMLDNYQPSVDTVSG